MSPRRYARTARDQAFAATRARIVDAAKELHAERGVIATSWHDVAERAGVSPVTVYRHFRSLRELIPACALSFVDAVDPISEEEARAAFAELPSAVERLGRLIGDNCACYERGRGWFHAAMREADLVPELGDVVRSQQATLRTLIRAALEGWEAPEELVSALVAVIDFPFWRSLIVAGVTEEVAPRIMLTIAEALLTKYGAAETPDHRL
jgi:AcrR family transcriptional regulator